MQAHEKDPLNNIDVTTLFSGEKIAEWRAVPHKIVNDRVLVLSVSSRDFDLQSEPLIANVVRNATGFESKFVPVNEAEYTARLQEFLYVREQGDAVGVGSGLNTGLGLDSTEIKVAIIEAQGIHGGSSQERL